MLNRYTMKSFNKIYYALKSSGRKRRWLLTIPFSTIDGIGQWNLVYGKQDFCNTSAVSTGKIPARAIEELLR